MTAGSRRQRRLGAAALALCALAACGKKGPPLAPLRYVPGPATDVKAVRAGNDVRLHFVLPTANLEGQGSIDLDRVEVYAATVAAESNNPPNRDLLVSKYLVGTVPVKPLRKEGEPEPPPGPPEDRRPAPGDSATFTEQLSAATLAPQITTPAPPEPAVPPPSASAAAAAGTLATVAALKERPVVRRIYVVRGLTRSGRPGAPSGRVVLPLIDLPAPPTGVAVKFSETALTVSWTASPAPGSGSVAYNIYHPGETVALNRTPLTSPSFERPSVTFGTEECFEVRAAIVLGAATLESAPSSGQCVTPADTFAPAAPKGLSAVGVGGAVNLIWEANTERDLGGYIVLRGEAPGDTLQAITPTPIGETTYRDTTVKAGVRYVYAVVAVDRATPPNMSPQSAKVEETAR